MQFSPFEDEIRPGVVNTQQDFLFAEAKIFVLMKQGAHIWLPYRLTERRTYHVQEKLMMLISTPGLTSFSNDKNYFIFSFSEPNIISSY